jgi:hemolysin III
MTLAKGAVAWNYDGAELIADGIVHAIGIILAVAGSVILLIIAFHTARGAEIGSAAVYAFGLLSMLGASAAYNFWPISPGKWLLRRFDHSAIYLLIASTYTPFLLRVESRAIAAAMLAAIWLIAAVGMTHKLLWPERLERLSIAFYLVLGWIGVAAYDLFAAALGPMTLWLIAVGGALYSIGVLFHVWERLRFHTAIWHGFVLSA